MLADQLYLNLETVRELGLNVSEVEEALAEEILKVPGSGNGLICRHRKFSLDLVDDKTRCLRKKNLIDFFLAF